LVKAEAAAFFGISLSMSETDTKGSPLLIDRCTAFRTLRARSQNVVLLFIYLLFRFSVPLVVRVSKVYTEGYLRDIL
jgi:hypothetical protein